MTIYRPALMAAAMAVMLTACGGDNDDDSASAPVPAPAPAPSPTGDVPASALLTEDAFVTFVGSLQNSATALPINVNGANPPKTETGVPKPI